MGLLSLDPYHFDFVMILKEPLTFLSLSNPVLQHTSKHGKFCQCESLSSIRNQVPNQPKVMLYKLIMIYLVTGMNMELSSPEN